MNKTPKIVIERRIKKNNNYFDRYDKLVVVNMCMLLMSNNFFFFSVIFIVEKINFTVMYFHRFIVNSHNNFNFYFESNPVLLSIGILFVC